MLEIIPKHKKFQLSKYFKIASVLSLGMVLFSLYLIFLGQGPNYGVDFRGGAEIQVGFTQAVDLEELRAVLTDGGLKGANVQTIGGPEVHDYLIKVQAQRKGLNTVTKKISQVLEHHFADRGLDRERFKKDIVGAKGRGRTAQVGIPRHAVGPAGHLCLYRIAL